MAENAWFCSLIVNGVPQLVNGSEVQNDDLALVSQTAALADDRTLAELFRIAPFLISGVSTTVRYILPYDISQVAPFTPGTLTPVLGGIQINPFRAVVGSRTGFATSGRDSWRDLRTGVFPGPTATSLSQTVSLAANSSGNTRWDLVYATLTIDAPTNGRTRRVKDPNSGAVSVVTVYQSLSQGVTINVQAGTPGASPVVPSLPADTLADGAYGPAGTYNIPLAAVRVPSGFTSASTPATGDVRDLIVAPPIAKSTGATTIRPANGNNDGAGTYAANFPWSTTGGSRPSLFLPPSMVGGEQIIVQIDYSNPAAPSHPNGSIIDNSVDWRDRMFIVVANGGITTGGAAVAQHFATENASGFANDGIPNPAAAWSYVGAANSTHFDISGPGQTKQLYTATSSNSGGILTGSMALGVYIDMDDGALKCMSSNSPVARLWLWIQATAQYPNF